MGLGGRGSQITEMMKERKPEPPLKARSRAARVIEWIERLKITSGMNAGQPFKLRPWQKRIIRSIYGKQPIRQCLITLPRKNGKTQLAAALALCALCGPEARPRGQVLSAAADRQQAALIFNEMKALIRSSEYLRPRIAIRDFTKELRDTETESTYAALSSDAKKAHGLSPVFVVCDELAQWRGRELYDALVTGTGAHTGALMVVISTMTADPAHIMSELVKYGEQVAEGSIEDKTFLPIIFRAPADADPWDEKVWRACNPALGDFRSLDEMRDTAAKARRLPAQEPAFRLLYLNQPVDAASRFLNGVDWDACRDTASRDLTGARCILGLDLSSTTDLTALAAYFPGTGDLRLWFWMPAESVREAEQRDFVPYGTWVRQGYIETTVGRAIDKSFVVRRLAEIASEYRVEAMAYDRWGSKELFRIMEDEGVKLTVEDWGQGWKDMAPALNAIEALVLDRKLRHDGHPVLKWCVSNAVAVSDPAGNRKLAKDRFIGRIDGLQAACMAVGLASRTPPKRPSIYEPGGRGLLVLGNAA